MTHLVLATLALCPVAAWLGRRGARTAMLLGLWPAALTGWLVMALRKVWAGDVVRDRTAWIPSLGLDLEFRLDGLGGLMALLVTGIGTCIVVYGAHYFDGKAHAGRFQASLFVFMAAMLGVVLTDNVLTLFVFWELTGFASFLLIGYEHDKPEARRAALQALVVTGSGGLALLAAAVLLSLAGNTTSLSTLIERGEAIRAHSNYESIVVLVLLAAFTKSAQFPFHFWLRDAMAAPTPVSAYLHSATMVKAGIYLLARCTPMLGDTDLWRYSLVAVGGLTMLGGAWRSVQETDLKRVLAYSTVGALGTMVLLLGLGTPAALTGAVLYLLAHAFYKGTLFQVAGIVDRATGTRELTVLGGLRKQLPWAAAAGVLAAASMAGLPLFVGFLAKEQVYLAALEQPLLPWVVTSALVVASMLLSASGLLVGWAPFAGRVATTETQRPTGPGLWLGPLLLAIVGLACGLPLVSTPITAMAVTSLASAAPQVSLALWHGWALPLLLSVITVLGTLFLHRARERLRERSWPPTLGFNRHFDSALRAIDALSARIAPAMQDATLATYARTFVVSAGCLIAVGLYFAGGNLAARVLLPLRLHEVLLLSMIVVGAVSAVRARSTMNAVLALGTAGYGVALTFLLYGAPDLAMTQFVVETLTAVIFVFVFWQFPSAVKKSDRRTKVRDALISCAFGVLVTLLALETSTTSTSRPLSAFFSENAPTLGHGRNVVNVILVDFRALDTMGEITVLAAAAVGVRALLRLAKNQRRVL